MILHYSLIKIVIHVGFCSEVLLPCNKELKQQKNPAVTVCSESYAVKSTNTSTKLNLSLRDTPQSVKVFTREDLEGRNIVSFQDLTNNITEVSSSRTDERQFVFTRGFQVDHYLIDGLPSTTHLGIGDIDLDIYDHIEVVKRLAHDLWASF